ncbi:9441_t:CDS:2, partial [Cetraspora pellucida]
NIHVSLSVSALLLVTAETVDSEELLAVGVVGEATGEPVK